CMVDCPDVITENSEHNNFQHVQHPGACYHACGPCACGQGGCGECLDGGCGDVNSDPTVSKVVVVNSGDATLLSNNVTYGAAYPGVFLLSCLWASDVNCDTYVNSGDATLLSNNVTYGAAYPGVFLLGCCGGACPP
ncbi:MAG: hypothetical protein U9Q37_10670, partial [Euryarchaeota archaeon]|nr:hypothetical protein [Euryarchaeota archaeon]